MASTIQDQSPAKFKWTGSQWDYYDGSSWSTLASDDTLIDNFTTLTTSVKVEIHNTGASDIVMTGAALTSGASISPTTSQTIAANTGSFSWDCTTPATGDADFSLTPDDPSAALSQPLDPTFKIRYTGGRDEV